MNKLRHPSSYRDPSGFVFEHDGVIYRQINSSYAGNYLLLKNSGLFHKLVSAKLIVDHEEMTPDFFAEAADKDSWKIIRPEKIQYISYPSEWSFDALKDAATLHLDIMELALSHGMILKDASPYNVQFVNGKAIFIDTLSFDVYKENLPWIAYRQFCECFLYPLLIEHYKLFYTHQLYAGFGNGIPAVETARLLPFSSRLRLGCWLHVFLPASVANSTRTTQTKISFSRQKMLNLLHHLREQISRLRPNNKSPAAWNTYYAETILSEEYLANKRKIVARLTDNLAVKTALDLGCNDGYFSKLLHAKGVTVLAVDNDAPSINRLFLENKKERADISPLVIDITAPTPATGFGNLERSSFLQRIHCDLIIALALVHHLVIGKNVPMNMLAAFFNEYARWLVIEFIPKDDPKVIAMLLNRDDVFNDYNEEQFEQSLALYFHLVEKTLVEGTKRSIYLYKRKDHTISGADRTTSDNP